VLFTDVENPALSGYAPLRLNAMTIERGMVARTDPQRVVATEVENYSPDGVRVRSLVPLGERSAFTDGAQISYAFLDVGARSSDSPPSIDLVGNWPFVLPSISLPADGSPREFVLSTIRARTATSVPPGSIPPPIGFDVQEIDHITLALAPSVLVLPVHVFVFGDENGTIPLFGGDEPSARLFFEQEIDPGAMLPGKVALADSGISSTVSVEAKLVLDMSVFAPDGPWRTCGIQFHLEAVEVIPQSDGLERTMFGVTNPCAPGSGIPFYDYLPGGHSGPNDELHAIPIFLSPILGVDLLGATIGATCGPFAGCRHVPRLHSFVALSRDTLFPLGGHALAHELGHYLGLGHPGGTDDRCEAAVAGTSNLMLGGGPADHSAASGELTPDQCQRARCLAAGWLSRWGRVGGEMAPEECGGIL